MDKTLELQQGTDKSGNNQSNTQPVNSSHLNSDGCAGEGDGDEDEGDTTSDEESTVDKHSDSKLEQEARNQLFSLRPASVAVSAHHSTGNPQNETEISKELNGYRKTNDEYAQSSPDVGKHGEKIRKSSSSKNTEETISGTSRLEARAQSWSSPKTGSTGGDKYKYSYKLGRHIVPSSSALTLADLDPQMALVMSSMPLSMLSRATSSPSQQKSSKSYNPLTNPCQRDEQPLDLSKKSERSTSSLSPNSVTKKCTAASGSTTSATSTTANGFSSLQSLQRRFGGEYPLELPHHQPSMTHKSAVAPHALPMSSDGPQRSGMSKPKPGPRSERAEKQDVTRALASSPMLKGSNSRHTSPLLADEPITEAGGKHTIHRCSCQKTFSTLYTLSLHLQETGHTPAASKTSSPMDYPKLVRGQDMWLNQESEQTRRILRCMQCGESFRSLPLLTVHMMQTQHYTKIVSSDHGRRSHKCSTYCDRELDRECIFKCKVCHEAFTDMEGLANHMIVSGHHKKQSSRQIPNPAAFSGDISCLTRQGRRKRLSPEDIAAVSGTNPSTVASLLVHRQKQMLSSHGEVNGFRPESKTKNESRSPESHPQRLVLCDSCGRHVESRDFDSHVRTCLKQRAEVIDALKNKLAIEEALLSRSESKLLRSGISLSPLSDHGKYLFTNTASAKKESPSEVQSSSCSLYEKINEVDRTGYPSQVKSEVSSPELDSNCASADSKSLPKNTEFCAKICDLIEVPLRKWYCSSEEPRHASSRGDSGNSDKRSESYESVQMSKTVLAERDHKLAKVVKQEHDDDDDDQEMPVNNTSVSSPGVGEKRKLHDADDPRDGVSYRRKRDKLSPDLIPETADSESLDFTSSALHKLDMFSRGLKFSPPRRNMPPESKLLQQHQHHHPGRISKKRETSLFIAKSPQPVPASPLSQLKAHSPEPPKQDVTFDIIDPNAGSEGGESSSSALEAMESFIHKSFSAKSDICSSNLASMFSPLRNCFPLPVSLPGQNGVSPESSDRALSQFAKFTKFFRMVPGAASLSETSSTPSLDSIKPAHSPTSPPVTLAAYETQHGTPHDKISHKKKAFAKPHNSASTIKVPHVNFPQELSLGAATTPLKLSSGKTVDGVHSSKKYKYSSSISVSAMLDSVRNWHHSQRLAQPSSGNILSENDRLEHAQGDTLLQSPVDNDTSTKELKKIFDVSLYHGNNEYDADNEKTDAIEENNEKDYTDYANKGRIHDSGKDDKCYEKHKNNSLYYHKQKHTSNSLSKSPVTVIKEECREIAEVESEVDEVKANVSHSTEMEEGRQLFPNSSQSAESVCKDEEEVDEAESVEDDNKSSRDGQFGSEMKDLLESKTSDRCEGVVPVEVKNRETVVKSPASVYENLCGKRSKLGLTASLKSGDDNSCHSDVDTEGSEDSASMAERVAVKKNRKLKDYRESELETHSSSDSNVLDKNVYKTQGIQYMADVKIIKREGEVDNSLRLCFGETGKVVSTQSDDVANDCLDNEVMGVLQDPIENKSDSEDFMSSMKHGTALKCSVLGKRPKSCKSEYLLKQKAAECADNTGAVSPDLNDDKMSEHTEIVMEKKAALVAKNAEEATGKPKTSALDSLSSFVYSQPLTSEHPLDCLHRLLSTNELSHLPADQQRYASTAAAAAYRCLSPDLNQAQNLTLKGRGGGGGGGGVSSGGCSSDENEEADPAAATEGGAVEGEIREYKCAACNRRFASKGSYRYHLSRCHLSSVKKYGIKEAFNMSPYVYLPLDHTAKFSKYYQMAHELANKGK